MRSILSRSKLSRRRLPIEVKPAPKSSIATCMPSARRRENMLAVWSKSLISTSSVTSSSSRFGSSPLCLDDVAHLIDQFAVDLHRRDVDRDAHVVRPLLRGLDRLAHDQVGQRRDQAVLFRELDEFGRRDRAEFRMEPAGERLEADDAHVARAHQRLEIGLDVAVLDRAAQLLAQHHAALAFLAEFLGEMAAAAAPFGLGVIEREIGVLQQVLGVVGVAPDRPRRRSRRRRSRISRRARSGD